MSSSDIKIDLFRKIDMLADDELERIHGELMNILNGTIDSAHWKGLSQAQQNGLHQATESLKAGMGMVHEEVMEKYRKRYSND
jgi:hypothetical protein